MADPYAVADVERLVRDYLADALADVHPDVTVTIGVPTNWTPRSAPHLQVTSDGVFAFESVAIAHCAVRLVAWSDSTTTSKAIAANALGLLAAHPGGNGIAVARPTTGPLPARDTETGGELAAVTARVTVRTIPIEPSGS